MLILLCSMLVSLVYLQQGNVKKFKKMTKIVITEKENLHIFRTTWGISREFFSGKNESYDNIKSFKSRALPSF